MANKILIPVDFSDYSNKAIEYACQLSKLTHHDIDLVHIFTDHTNIYRNAMDNVELIDPRVGTAKRDMEKLISNIIDKLPEVNINSIFKDGNLYDEIRKLVSTEQYDAIVMGTKGSSGLDALLIGSNMFDVFQNTKIPVLAVPFTTARLKTEKIGLLCNFKDGELDVLKQAIKVFGKNFELFLIHINTQDQTIKTLDARFKSFIERIIVETGLENISYIIKAQNFLAHYKSDISSAINTVIADELLDVILVTKSKKGFLRKIMEENIVKKMAYQVQIPKFFGRSPQ
ncbi:universal stress protein [Sphingobacterium sp. Mn56C]|uniref:universal stress protein n=1 Tax=Sphingobacterium sp. Mn56C TaxID=3395261 RepID=UPI003BBDE450